MSRVRVTYHAATARLRAHASSLMLAAAAAGIAYAAAGLLVGPENAVFAPIAAVVATGLSAGQRVRRAAEISTGVVVGIVIADLLTRAIGVGPLQLTLAVLLAMGTAVAIRPSGLLANQAAVAAVVVMALVPHLDAGPWTRLSDALVGGAVAVVLNAVASPDPYRMARSVTCQVVARIELVTARVARAVLEGSLPEAEEALADTAGLDSARDDIADALSATHARLAWRRGERRGRDAAVTSIEAVASRVPIMVATSRALARAAANLVRHTSSSEDPVRARLAGAVDHLAGALTELQAWIGRAGDSDAVRHSALSAAVAASAQLPGASPAHAIFVGQVRSAAVDLLRATGLSQAESIAMLEDAAGRA